MWFCLIGMSEWFTFKKWEKKENNIVCIFTILKSLFRHFTWFSILKLLMEL